MCVGLFLSVSPPQTKKMANCVEWTHLVKDHIHKSLKRSNFFFYILSGGHNSSSKPFIYFLISPLIYKCYSVLSLLSPLDHIPEIRGISLNVGREEDSKEFKMFQLDTELLYFRIHILLENVKPVNAINLQNKRCRTKLLANNLLCSLLFM